MKYQDAVKEVRELVSPPKYDDVRESFTPMVDVYRDTISEMRSPEKYVQIPGWDKFNHFTGGLRMHELSVLCGPTGTGKTAFLQNVAVQLVSQMVPAFVASVETGKNDFMRRMISNVANKDCNSGREITDADRAEIDASCKLLFKNKNSVFSNYDSRVDPQRLMADMLYAHREHGCKVALLDNMNFFMEVTSAKEQYVQMDRAFHEFIQFTKKVEMHTILVMHPRKTESGRVESEFDIKGSATAVQEAQNVLLWNRLKSESDVKEQDDSGTPIEPKYCREIKFAKVRKRGRSVGSKVFYHLTGLGERMTEVGFK